MPQSGPHDEFLELCAAFTTGDLSDDEQKKLKEHLATCSTCREALRQYQSIIGSVLPAIAAAEVPQETPNGSSRSQEKQDAAEGTLPPRLRRELTYASRRSGHRNSSSFFPHRILPFSNDSTWWNAWRLYAAGILLFCALTFFAYRVGTNRAREITTARQPQPSRQYNPAAQSSLEEQLSDAGHDRAVANAEIAQRDKLIADLRRLLLKQSAEINELKTAQNQLANQLQADDANKQTLFQQKAELAQKLDFAENNSKALQQKLELLSEQSSQDGAMANASQARVNELTRQLQEQQAAVAQRDEMLAKDRDIRELMGARDLYMTEIYDIAGTGETRTPYGRLFYTRGKSLIFYAYDLDEQKGLKSASTFQAWGRRGPDVQRAINLGVFYEDNETKKRWIVKCDDPKTLAQIDGVFVTVEPRGGSRKPTSKGLLFASLKIEPNHP